MNLLEFIEYFENNYNIATKEDTKKIITDRNVRLNYSDYQVEKLKNYLCDIGGKNPNLLQEKLNEIAEEARRNNSGKIYENLFYTWLYDKGISFKEQVNVPKNDCLKAKEGYSSDGRIAGDLYFDVKSFGMNEKLVVTLKQKLQKVYPNDLITIHGNKDIDISIYEKLIRDVNSIVENLKETSDQKKDSVKYEIEDGEIVIHRYIDFLDEEKRKNTKCQSITEISEMDFTRWAENNETYPLKHGAQFIKNHPFILVYPFKKYEFALHINDDKDAFWAFRFLARRLFLNSGKKQTDLLSDYDKNADENISVSDAVSHLSGILFWNIDAEWDYDNNQMWLYCNPNAVNKIPNYMIHSNFRNMGCCVDTFEYDNY